MMPVSQWLTVVDALGIALVHFLWQGAALGALYFLLRQLCASPAARYRVGCGFLLALAACPILTLARAWPPAATPAVNGAGFDAGAVAAASSALPNWTIGPLLPWLVAVWSCGVAVIAVRAVWQWRRLQRLVRMAEPAGAVWESRLARLRGRFAVSRPVRLLRSAQALTPMLVGWFKPAIVLPASLLSGFPAEQVELIIAHELGHIRRWDYLANLVQVVVETVLFYHPVVHWVSRDVRNAREECCDDLVLRVATGNALAYAHALAGLEQMRLDASVPALGASGGALLARIRRIVDTGAMVQPAPRNLLLPLLLLAASLICLVWRMQQRDEALMGAIVSELPGQMLALISGNPQLVAAPQLSVSLPVPRIVPPALPALAGEDPDVRIERPRMLALVAGKLAPVRDLALANLRVAVPASAPVVAEADPPLQKIAPVYPPRAMAAGIEGSVELAYRIGADGRPAQIRVVHAQPAGVFVDAATAALVAWSFAPVDAGQERRQNFVFALGKSATSDKCQSPTGTMICRHPGD